MTGQFAFNTILVPVDFSPTSKAAFQQAVQLLSGDSPVIILLHVVDSSLVEFAEAYAFDADVASRMRQNAEAQMQHYASICPDEVEMDPIISEGIPFLEILQKSNDFAVDAIVMGKIGRRGKVEKLLFGSTAEKVIRASDKPVLVLPHSV